MKTNSINKPVMNTETVVKELTSELRLLTRDEFSLNLTEEGVLTTKRLPVVAQKV